ncbi:MAG: hypothetical protein ACRD2L_05480 [Terriglobia bacterium]
MYFESDCFLTRKRRFETQNWLILSHEFNMNGRAASHTMTDKIPHLLEAGIEPIVISAPAVRRDSISGTVN